MLIMDEPVIGVVFEVIVCRGVLLRLLSLLFEKRWSVVIFCNYLIAVYFGTQSDLAKIDRDHHGG